MKKDMRDLRLIQRIVERRGSVAYDDTLCVFCGLCVKACPMGAIALDREERSLRTDHRRCVRCGKCVEACPKKARRIQKMDPDRGEG